MYWPRRLIRRGADIAGDRNLDVRPAANASLGEDGLHGRSKIQRIQSLRQICRQAGMIDGDIDHVAGMGHLLIRAVATEADDHATFAIGTTAEIDVGDGWPAH